MNYLEIYLSKNARYDLLKGKMCGKKVSVHISNDHIKEEIK